MAENCKYFMKPNNKLFRHLEVINNYLPKEFHTIVKENYHLSVEKIIELLI